MSDGQPKLYKHQHGLRVKEPIQAISTTSKQTGKLGQFIGILEKAVHLLQTDPHGWGDPQYRSKFVDGLFCQALFGRSCFVMSSTSRLAASCF